MTQTAVEANTHLQADGGGSLSTPRFLPRPHFEHNTTNAPDVDLGIVPLLWVADYFRCGPKHGTLGGIVGTGHVDVVLPLRSTKTRNLTDSELNENCLCRQALE